MVQFVIFDIDGVLTDGKVYYAESGEREKCFHCRDIPAIKRLTESGFTVIILTKSTWKGAMHFAKRIPKSAKLVTGVEKKDQWVKENLNGASFIAVCDDVDDIPMCELAKRVFFPSDSASNFIDWAMKNKEKAFQLQSKGGQGLVELIESILDTETSLS